MTKNSLRKYSLIAALCFGVLALHNIANILKYIGNTMVDAVNFSNVVYQVVLITFAVLLFLERKNLVFVVAAVASLLLRLCNSILYSLPVSYIDVLTFISDAVFALIVATSCIPKLESYNIAQKLWLLPAILRLIYSLVNWVNWIEHQLLTIYPSLWLTFAMNILGIAAYLFACMWLSGGMSVLPKKDIQAERNEAMIRNNCVIGDADKLKTYKDLLDSGVITQEEFEQKKRQILGL